MPNNKRELTSDDESKNSKRQKVENVDSNVNNPEEGINKLPNEILHKIGGFFDKNDRGNFALTNKRFKSVADDLTIQELNIVLPKLGFAGMKDNKSLNDMKLIEVKEIYKQLKIIEKQCGNALEIFDSIASNYISDGYPEHAAYCFNIPMNKTFSNLYSIKELVPFKINWAEVFDNGIIKYLKSPQQNFNQEDINDFFQSLMQGESRVSCTLLSIIIDSFKDPDCKDILKLLIEKYGANFNYVDKFNQTIIVDLQEKNKNRNNFSQSISYIQDLIQSQNQNNINNQP